MGGGRGAGPEGRWLASRGWPGGGGWSRPAVRVAAASAGSEARLGSGTVAGVEGDGEIPWRDRHSRWLVGRPAKPTWGAEN